MQVLATGDPRWSRIPLAGLADVLHLALPLLTTLPAPRRAASA